MTSPTSIPLIAIYKEFGLVGLIESILIVAGGLGIILLGVYLITDD